MLHITKDNFVWLNVTETIQKNKKKVQEYWSAHELYAVYDDDSESLIESHEEIDEALKLGVKICIEGGHLPTEYKTRTIWKDTNKELINGYWYVKISDLKFGSV
jgi:type I site-specific restriction-modification system R (restriction) subunit